ncbi:MAG: hypothetical protein LQ337_003667 [Flavoplaca oasis]|nr:MAG: hypothetical protein LQ337_003667 [Flavoplaca oasis]
MRLTNIRLIIALLLVLIALSAQRSDAQSLVIRSRTSTQPSYPVAIVRPEPIQSNPTPRVPGLRARLWSLAAKIPWIGPRFFVGRSEQSIAVMATDIAIWSITTVALVKDATILFFQVHVVDYYRRTARYIDGVYQDEEMQQQQAQMASEDPSQLTKDLAVRPSEQTRIAQVAAQAGFRPDEVVPYPALLLEQLVRVTVQYRHKRGVLQTMEDAVKAPLREIGAWFGKLKLWVYRILVLIACALIAWLLFILAPVIKPFFAAVNWSFGIILQAPIDASWGKLVVFVVAELVGFFPGCGFRKGHLSQSNGCREVKNNVGLTPVNENMPGMR